MPSTGLPGTETMLPAPHYMPIELTSFQWGIGRGISEASSVPGQVVEDVRLRRIVMGATMVPTGGTILAARPTESITFNFETITLN
jgi:hypothetical protein